MAARRVVARGVLRRSGGVILSSACGLLLRSGLRDRGRGRDGDEERLLLGVVGESG